MAFYQSKRTAQEKTRQDKHKNIWKYCSDQIFIIHQNRDSDEPLFHAMTINATMTRRTTVCLNRTCPDYEISP